MKFATIDWVFTVVSLIVAVVVVLLLWMAA